MAGLLVRSRVRFFAARVPNLLLLSLLLLLLRFFFLQQDHAPGRPTAARFSKKQMHLLEQVAYVPTGSPGGRRVVVIAPTTFHYRHFLVNMQCTMNRVTGRQALVFALDNKVARFAKARGYPVLGPLHGVSWKGGGDGTVMHSYNSDKFRSISKMKLDIVRRVLATGLDVLLTDVDIVWCDDAVKNLSMMVERGYIGDVLIQSDAPRFSSEWVRLNTGFYYATSTPQVIALFDKTIQVASRRENAHLDDQKSFILTACNWTRFKLSEEALGQSNLTMCRWDRRVYVRALPILKYLNGAAFVDGVRVHRLPEGRLSSMCMSKQIAIWHNNWCDSSDKLTRFTKWGMWFVHDSNYTCSNTPLQEATQTSRST